MGGTPRPSDQQTLPWASVYECSLMARPRSAGLLWVNGKGDIAPDLLIGDTSGQA